MMEALLTEPQISPWKDPTCAMANEKFWKKKVVLLVLRNHFVFKTKYGKFHSNLGQKFHRLKRI